MQIDKLNEEPHVSARWDATANLFYAWITLPSGHTVQLFVNQGTGLLVVDVNHKNERGGNEVVRTNVNEVDLSHCVPRRRKAKPAHA